MPALRIPKLPVPALFWTGIALLALCLGASVFTPQIYNFRAPMTLLQSRAIRGVQEVVSFLYTVAELGGVFLIVGSLLVGSATTQSQHPNVTREESPTESPRVR